MNGDTEMTGVDLLGTGVGFDAFSKARPDLAEAFPSAVESVRKRFDIRREGGMSDPPYANWSFHDVGRGHWVARLVSYRESEPLYLEWNAHSRLWDALRAHSSVELLTQEPTRPIRIRPRGSSGPGGTGN